MQPFKGQAAVSILTIKPSNTVLNESKPSACSRESTQPLYTRTFRHRSMYTSLRALCTAGRQHDQSAVWLQWTGICWDRIDFNYKLFHPILYHMKVKVLLAQSCPTLCNPMDCSLPGSSVRGILQARILEWVAIPFSRGSSRFRDQTRSPTLQADPLPSELAGKPIFYHIWIYLVFLIVFCQRRKETLAMDCNPRFQAKTSCHHSWWSQANLSFLICKMGITVVPPSLDCCEN